MIQSKSQKIRPNQKHVRTTRGLKKNETFELMRSDCTIQSRRLYAILRTHRNDMDKTVFLQKIFFGYCPKVLDKKICKNFLFFFTYRVDIIFLGNIISKKIAYLFSIQLVAHF